ncbi:MAG: ABC transporter ATP-binding protein [Steroidobacteraceae bacterium]
MLEVDRLCVTFDTPDGAVPAVAEVSFRLERGECLGIVGESGAGKSQSLLALMGLLPSQAKISGTARFNGESLLDPRDSRAAALRGRQMAMIFQDPMTSLTPHMTVGEQIGESLRRHLGLNRSAARERTLALLRQVQVTDVERRWAQYPHELSGGMRQRVMIAMALACDPPLLIADEPTTALDVTIQAQILSVLVALKRERGMALALITHDLGVIAGVADRVLVMYGGRVVETGSVREVLGTPRHPYTRALLDSMPRLDATGQGPLQAIAGQPPNPRRLPSGCAFHPRCRHSSEHCRSVRPESRDGVACHHPLTVST